MNKEKLFLTVFTPTYNRVHTLERVYNSICKQTLQTINEEYIFEWIIVDDGSTDNTKELVKKWQNEANFPIRYFYQKNQGKPTASRKGIEEAKGELFLFADSDDEFLSETFKTFYNIWNSFDNKEKERCNDINCLCIDQYGNKISNKYPYENSFIFTQKAAYKYKNQGETWAAMKTKNLKKFFKIPPELKEYKFIPESFFWNRIINEANQYTYITNKYLRVYYTNEGNNLSTNIREKYPKSFEYEALYFINNYQRVLYGYPKIYLRYLFKYNIYSRYNKVGFSKALEKIDNTIVKFLHIILYLPSMLLEKIKYKV